MINGKKSISEYGTKLPNKDYQRVSIGELCGDYGKRAFLITCKYKENNNDKYATFSNVRVFDPESGSKTKYQLTDHVNFPRKQLSRYIDLNNPEYRGKKFFVMCVPHTYNHFGLTRWGLGLLFYKGEFPIIRAPMIKSEWDFRINRMLNVISEYNKNEIDNHLL